MFYIFEHLDFCLFLLDNFSLVTICVSINLTCFVLKIIFFIFFQFTENKDFEPAVLAFLHTYTNIRIEKCKTKYLNDLKHLGK